MAVAKKAAEMASEKAAAKSLLLLSELNIVPFLREALCVVGAGDQAMRPAGLAGTMAAAMNIAETLRAKTAATALLLA